MAENSILSPVSLTSYFDNQTGEARQANLFFYKAGTLDPITVYTDSTLHIPFPQPVATTGWGRVPPVYIGEIPPPGYRVRTFDQYETLIEDLDGLPGADPDPSTVPDPTPVDPDALFRTGDIKLSWQNHQTLPGWIEITNGGTIGAPGSNASLMQHDDCHALFLHLWQQDAVNDSDAVLLVLPNKGPTAEGDWAGDAGGIKKQITVPDARGRFLVGLDTELITAPAQDPRRSTTNRLDAGLFDNLPKKSPETKMTPWTLGASGGEATHKLVVTELAVHFHDWIDYAGHTHAVWDPTHSHTINDPGHTHGLTTDLSGSDQVVGRGGNSYSLWDQHLAADGNHQALFAQATLAVGSGITNITATNPVATGVVLLNINWDKPTLPGYNLSNAYVGVYKKKMGTGLPTDGDNLWHQPTENQPRPDTWGVEAERGDKPHNTLPPFIQFAIYMKL